MSLSSVLTFATMVVNGEKETYGIYGITYTTVHITCTCT